MKSSLLKPLQRVFVVGVGMTKVILVKIYYTRKYPLCGYILGVLTHTTGWYQHWEGDETLKLVLVYVAWLLLS